MYDLKKYIKETGNYHFKIVLGTTRTRLIGASGGAFVVSVKAKGPRAGASELLAFLAKSLRVYGSSLSLVSGRGSTRLTVYIYRR